MSDTNEIHPATAERYADLNQQDKVQDAVSRGALSSDTVILSRADFEKILSRFKYCLDELWYEYKSSYSKDRFKDYFAEEYEALAILEKNGGGV